MNMSEVLKQLKRQEEKSLREGYRGDAASYAFKRFVLLFLKEIAAVKKRRPSSWNKFVAEYLKQGKTIKDAAKDWKKK